MSRDQAQQGRAPAAAARGGATTHEGDDLAKGQAAVQILEGGGLFPRITSWAASAIEQANYVGAAEASRRWFTNRPYLRTLARSFDAGDPTVKQAQALLDDMEPFEDRLPTVLELTFAGSEQGTAAWLARIGRAPKAAPADANEPAATAVPAVQSPLRPENVKSGWDYVTGAALGGVAILHGEAHRGGTDPLADMINNAVDSSAYAKGFAVGGVEGAWDALKDNARIFDDINDLIVDLVKAKVAGGDIGVLLAVRDKIMGLIAAGKQVPAAIKAFAERWNDASDLAAQGHFQGHAVGYIAVQVLALVIGAIAPGGQYADVIRILKLATDPLGGLLELGTAAKATRAARTAGKVEHAAEGAVAGERAGVHAAEGAATGERKLGGVFEEAGAPGGRPYAEPAPSGAASRPGRPPAAGEGAADASAGAAMRVGDEPAGEVRPAAPFLEGIAKPLSRSEALLDGLPTDLRGRVRIIESPVLTDSTVRVSYRDGIVLVVGAEATPRHIAYHASTVRVLLRFEGLAGEIRKLIDKVLTHLRLRAGYGTRGFEAELEVQKLTGMRDDLQRLLARTDSRLQGGDALEPDLLRAELGSVETQLAEHRQSLGAFEHGRGIVAAEGVDSTAGNAAAGSPGGAASQGAHEQRDAVGVNPAAAGETASRTDSATAPGATSVQAPLDAGLEALRAGLVGDDARLEFDRLVQRVGPDKAQRAFDGMARSQQGLEGSLVGARKARERAAATQPPFGPAISELGALRTRLAAVVAEIEQYVSSGRAAEGAGRWMDKLRGEAAQLNELESGRLATTSARTDGLRNNVDAIRAELVDAKRQDARSVEQIFKFGDGELIEIDNVNRGGDVWSEVKNKKPFGLRSSAWRGEVLPQARNMLRAAKEHGIPTVRMAFPRGVTQEVANELEAMGIMVDGRRVAFAGGENQ